MESFWAFLHKLPQYGKLMEASFDIQYGNDGKLWGFFVISYHTQTIWKLSLLF